MTTASEMARDAGLARVSCKNATWMNRGLAMLRKMKFQSYSEVTGEEIRHFLLTAGLEPPSTHKAWGALVNWAVRDGVLEDTGRMRKMVTEKSHARRTPVWKLT